jgi:ankyrin repeat protein
MNVNKQDTLHDAVFKGDIDNIDRLISEGCDVNEIREGNGTPLNLLTIYRHDFWDHSERNLNKKTHCYCRKIITSGG